MEMERFNLSINDPPYSVESRCLAAYHRPVGRLDLPRGRPLPLQHPGRIHHPAHTLAHGLHEPGQGHPHEGTVSWEASRTAVVVCDMWDQHHCPDATERVGEMAPAMNEVLQAARAQGMLILHCPSDTLKFYQDHPGRKLAQAAPPVKTTIPLQGWCSRMADHEAPLPIDDSDGGCDGCPECPGYGAWTRQHPALEIRDGDAITDSAEALYLMRQRGITNVIVMGVHINMCVLGRPFAIRQMVQQGQNVVLMRDMTDSMYNHRKAPYVSHFRGTELVVEHIERFWCPSITRADFTGKPPSASPEMCPRKSSCSSAKTNTKLGKPCRPSPPQNCQAAAIRSAP